MSVYIYIYTYTHRWKDRAEIHIIVLIIISTAVNRIILPIYIITAQRRVNIIKGSAVGLIYAWRGGGIELASENLQKTKKTIPRTPDGLRNITSGQRGGHILPSFRFNYGSPPYHMYIIQYVYI